MAKDFFGRLEETISTTGKAAAQKAKEVADSAKRHNDLRVAKRDLNDLYRQVGEKYFEEHMDYPQAEYIDPVSYTHLDVYKRQVRRGHIPP